MRNWEKYEKEVIKYRDNFAVNRRGDMVRCGDIPCKECVFGKFFCNTREKIFWLYKECSKYKVKLTVEELAFLKAMRLSDGHLARDRDGELYVFNDIPHKTRNGKTWEGDIVIKVDEKLFSFVTWKSGEAWAISDLLKLGVE